LQLRQQQFQQQQIEELTDDQRRAIRRGLVDDMVMRAILVQRASEAGYRVSDERLFEDLQSDPQFQIGGNFSRDVYVTLLAGEGLTPAGWEARQRDQLTLLDWQRGLVASSFVTPAEVRRRIELAYERREISYALYAAADHLAEVEIADEAVAEYHETNGDLFMTEESVDIELIELGLASIAETIELGEQDLRDYYETEVASFAAGEERRVRHILIEIEGGDLEGARAEAEAALARVEAGEDFAAVAAEVSDDAGTRNFGGDLGWQARGGLLEGPFEDQLFAMSVGETAGPVETEFGYHVLRLDERRAAEPEPFEAVRDQLYEQLAAERAYALFYDQANDLANDAYDARNELRSIADAYGLELQTIDGLTRGGQAGELATPILAAAFDPDLIATGENSDQIVLDEDNVAVIRVREHRPPEPRPLEEVADEIRSILEQEAAADLANEAATAYFDALDATGDDVLAAAESLAAEHGASWNPPQWIERFSAAVPASIVSLVFSQQKPEGGTPGILRTGVGGGDQAVVFFTAVEAGLPEDVVVAEREDLQQQLTEIAVESEVNAYAAGARADASVRVPDEILDPQF
jgi:peptidyl-prolyl cis-trans isomerase D